jgi:hypothetical protein
VAVVADQLDRPIARGQVQRRAQGRVRVFRLVAAGEGPLRDIHPLAGREVQAGDAGLPEVAYSGQRLGLAGQVAAIDVDDGQWMDLGVDQARQPARPEAETMAVEGGRIV